MFLPIAAEGRRRLVPAATIAIVAVNVLVHVLMIPVTERAEQRHAAAWRTLESIETEIATRHHAPALDAGAPRTGRAGRAAHATDDYWRRWDRGEIVPRTDPDWSRRAEAVAELQRAAGAHPEQRFGFRAAAPDVIALLASAFLHGGWLHLLGNMLMLWALSAPLEESWGRRLLLLVYALGVVLPPWAGLVGPGRGTIPCIGASAAVSAVAGAFAVRHFAKKLRVFLVLPLPGVYVLHGGWFLLAWFAWQMWEHGRSSETSGTAYGQHALGFLVGLGAAFAFRALGSEAAVEPAQEAMRRKAEREAHEAHAQQALAHGEWKLALQELRAARDVAPDDPELALKLADLLHARGEAGESLTCSSAALDALWRRGHRDRYVQVFRQVEQRHGELPPDFASRAALALEGTQPHDAAALHARVIEGHPGDPAARRSLQLYARLLDRLGEHDKAAQVRALAPRLEKAERRPAPR